MPVGAHTVRRDPGSGPGGRPDGTEHGTECTPAVRVTEDGGARRITQHGGVTADSAGEHAAQVTEGDEPLGVSQEFEEIENAHVAAFLLAATGRATGKGALGTEVAEVA